MSRTVKVAIVLPSAFFLLLFIFLLIGHLFWIRKRNWSSISFMDEMRKESLKEWNLFNTVHFHFSALIIIHSYLGSPDIFCDIANNKKVNAKVDVYVSLLPYEGRNLETVSKYNNKLTSDYLKTYVNKLSPHYKYVWFSPECFIAYLFAVEEIL